MATKRFECTEIDSLTTLGSPPGFADALSIWINKPHVVNRRLCGSKIVSMETHSSSDFRTEVFEDHLRQLGYECNDMRDLCHGKETRQTIDSENTVINGSLEKTDIGDTSLEIVQMTDDCGSSGVTDRVDSVITEVCNFTYVLT